MKYILILLFLFPSITSFSQSLFSRYYDLHPNDYDFGWEVAPTDYGIFAVGNYRCEEGANDLCAQLLLFDYDGDILWQKKFSSFKVQRECLYFDEENEHLYISGHTSDFSNDTLNDFLHLYKCDTNGDSIWHYSYEIPIVPPNYVAVNNGLTMQNNQIVMYGGGRKGETIQDDFGHILWINSDGSLDTIVYTNHGQDLAQKLYGGQVDAEGNFVVMYERTNIVPGQSGVPSDVPGFLKYNANKELIWIHDYAPVNLNPVFPVFTISENNDITFAVELTEHYTMPDLDIIIRRISETQDSIWEYGFPEFPTSRSRPLCMTTADNGDVLVGGARSEADFDLQHNYEAGHLYRIDSEGALLWERRFRDFDVNGNNIDGAFLDVKELDDGRLVLFGFRNEFFANSTIRRLWLMVTNEYGCLTEGETDCGEVIILDDKEIVFPDSEVSLIQNPVRETIRLQFDLPYIQDIEYRLFDSVGRLVDEGKILYPDGIQTIPADRLPSGMNYLHLLGDTKSRTFKVVK